jgi:hypothetical protein
MFENLSDSDVSGGGLEEYCAPLNELITCLKEYYQKWERCEDVLLSHVELSYNTPLISSGARGRPQFEITKNQLLCLRSLNFNWTEMAKLLGVSRMTLYRRRIEYDLVVPGQSEILSDNDLITIIQQIRRDAPYSAVQMMWGSLRERGVRVARDKLREILRSMDPLGSARRWPPAMIKRRPYSVESVPGPNSLWHIG